MLDHSSSSLVRLTYDNFKLAPFVSILSEDSVRFRDWNVLTRVLGVINKAQNI